MSSNTTFRDNVWITSKSRMQSEKRCNTYFHAGQLLLPYYAFWMIVTSQFADKLSERVNAFDEITLSISIFLFAMTLIVAVFRFDEKGRVHRSCYLELQRILAEIDDDTALRKEYNKIMERHPNHSTTDYEDLLIDRFLKGDKIKNSEGDISVGFYIWVKKVSRSIISYGALILSIILPPALLFLPFVGE